MKALKTDPKRADTDGDGDYDSGEIAAGLIHLTAAARRVFLIDGVGSDWSAVSGWRPTRGKREGDADIKGVRSVGDTNNRLLRASGLMEGFSAG